MFFWSHAVSRTQTHTRTQTHAQTHALTQTRTHTDTDTHTHTQTDSHCMEARGRIATLKRWACTGLLTAREGLCVSAGRLSALQAGCGGEAGRQLPAGGLGWTRQVLVDSTCTQMGNGWDSGGNWSPPGIAVVLARGKVCPEENMFWEWNMGGFFIFLFGTGYPRNFCSGPEPGEDHGGGPLQDLHVKASGFSAPVVSLLFFFGPL